ncbi:MAG: hypothetical protein ACFFD3_07740 [Candidatus Thorarchaeota archaeon]
MHSKTTLKQKFHEITSKLPTSEDLNDVDEVISTLYQDDWLRILVIRQVENPSLVTIEVESSLPVMAHGNPPRNDANPNATALLNGMIRTLEYLLNLQRNHFSLDIIGQDCMWTAYREFEGQPDEDIFRILTPP